MVERSPVVSRVLECAIAVHRELGPGLLESSYERCLVYEFSQRGVKFRSQVPLPIEYHGVEIDCGYRLDFVVEDTVLVELKSIERVLPIHHAQVRTYLKLSRLPRALLLNFNSRLLKEGLFSFLATGGATPANRSVGSDAPPDADEPDLPPE
jgi:GxxExxY protein